MIPLSVISGFLGAGKTTLLRRLLSEPQGLRYGVAINDFASLNIDARLIADLEPRVATLTNGCICCTIRGDLVATVLDLMRASPPPDHILLETSGVSNPLAVADTFLTGDAARRFNVDAILCMFDAANFCDLDYAGSELALEQAAVADFVVINKTDLCTEAQLQRLEETIYRSSPSAQLFRTSFANVPLSLVRSSLFPRVAARTPRGEGARTGHAEDFSTWTWRSATPLCLERFREATRQWPHQVYRAKGVLRFREAPAEKAHFHRVGRRSTLDFWPNVPNNEHSELVAIGREMTGAIPRLSALLNASLMGSDSEGDAELAAKHRT